MAQQIPISVESRDNGWVCAVAGQAWRGETEVHAIAVTIGAIESSPPLRNLLGDAVLDELYALRAEALQSVPPSTVALECLRAGLKAAAAGQFEEFVPEDLD